ncbi:hypothetical protein KR059_012675, partial [Drosophila kikkawai]
MSNDYRNNKGRLWLSEEQPEASSLINTITHDLLCLSIGGGEAHYESSLQRLKSESLALELESELELEMEMELDLLAKSSSDMACDKMAN